MKYITLTIALLAASTEAVKLKFGFSMPAIDVSAITEAATAATGVDASALETLTDTAALGDLAAITDTTALTDAAALGDLAALADTAAFADTAALGDLAALTDSATLLGTDALAGNLAGADLVGDSLALAGDAAATAGVADLVMVCAPGPAIPEVLRQSAAKGIRGAFVVSGGFRELGEDGLRAEQELG